MKNYIILFLLLLSNFSFSQDFTHIAIGEAELEKISFAFVQHKIKGNVVQEDKSKIDELMSLLKNDFGFYIHKYKIIDSRLMDDVNSPNYKQYQKKNYGIAVIAEFVGSNNTITLNLKAIDVHSKEIKFSVNTIVSKNNIRSFGHGLANDIYQSLNEGKKSIFNSKIVFVSDRSSTSKEMKKELYIMDFDGRRMQRLTFKNSMVISPSISPDNTKILYTVIEDKWRKGRNGRIKKVKNLNLYLYNILTKKEKLISSENGINSGAVFTADSKNIYLTLSHHRNADIFKIDLATMKRSKVTSHRSDDVDPSVNRDGTKMTFLSGRSGRAMIYTMNPNFVERDVKRISYVGKFNATPRFSPDGSEIVFSSWVDNRFDIYRIDSNGRNLVRLTKNFGSNEEPNFSPDGEFVVFTSQRVLSRSSALQDVYIMNRDGEVVGRITKNFGNIFSPRWSN